MRFRNSLYCRLGIGGVADDTDPPHYATKDNEVNLVSG
jgi:hypothetical protein